jgi:hypothetical protein
MFYKLSFEKNVASMWQVVTEEIRHYAKMESTGEIWNVSTASLKMRMQIRTAYSSALISGTVFHWQRTRNILVLV